MNGVHDMGGQHCHGPVIVESDESLFHHEWERRVLALVLACGATGTWNLDQSRFSRESHLTCTCLQAITKSGLKHWSEC